MARQWTTKTQVSGYRFLLLRLQHALVRRDSKMINDPMRSHNRSLTLGIILAILLAGICGALAMIHPQGNTGLADIFITREDGTIYAKVENKIHPVLNLASARLIVGKAQTPRVISINKLKQFPRGPLLGIPGAPVAIQNRILVNPQLTTCDLGNEFGDLLEQITMGGKVDLGKQIRGLANDEAIYVTTGNDYYLIYQGFKSKINPKEGEVMAALGLDKVTPKPISSLLLNIIPQVADLEVPKIPNVGGESNLHINGVPTTIGTVFKTRWQDQVNYYLLLKDSVQNISETMAKIFSSRYQNLNHESETAEKYVSNLPQSNTILLTQFPPHAPTVIGKSSNPVICGKYERENSEGKLSFFLGESLNPQLTSKAVNLVSADGAGPNLDKFLLPPGTAMFLQSTTAETKEEVGFNFYYVSDLGVKYPLASKKDAEYLGLPTSASLVPNGISKLFVTGPSLSRQNALLAQDTIQVDSTKGMVVSTNPV